MKKLFFKILLIASVLFLQVITMAMGRVDGEIRIPLPPAIVFPGPPNLVVIPETYVYADPDLAVDIFFYQGWWWRPWEGRWYRSRDYRKGWRHYQQTPSFYRKVPQDWRNSYRERRWRENQWEQQRIPHRKVQKNWKYWERGRYWEKHNNWGVKKSNSRKDSRREYRDDDNSDDSRDRRGKNRKEEKERDKR